MTYISKEGDVVDAICFRQYGGTTPYTEAVLEANPGLAALGPQLPAGIEITLPEITDTQATIETIKLWD